VAFLVGAWAIAQLWLFWLAPIIGRIRGATIYGSIGTSDNRFTLSKNR
jgi:aquaporin Z